MFDHYLAFGDSLSIDDYAGPKLGAASLLYSNRDDFWPEFTGMDVCSLNPRCSLRQQACNGAVLAGLWRQLTEAPRLNGRVLVTVTIGGNDVLAGLGQSQQGPAYACGNFFGSEPCQGLLEWQQSLQRWLDSLEGHYSQVQVVLGNVYDPTDGTGLLQSGASLGARYPMFEAMNDVLRRVAAQRGLALADLHGHFLGRASQLIYREIEPTPLGSSEIRRVFWDSIQ